MKKFSLRGLAEGLAGRSSVTARDINEVFAKFPALQKVRSKLTIRRNTISGFCACDG